MSLSAFVAPRGIAVVGASTDPDKLGGAMAANLAAYDGHLALVNPRAEGMHDSVADAVASAPDAIDLAVLCIPAPACVDAIAQCGAAGVPAVLVCAAGFAETGEEGARLQERLLEAARAAGVRVLGPNTSGYFVPDRRLLASFVPAVGTLREGRVGVVAASGGINHALAFALQRAGAGLSLGVGLGAAADVAAPEVLDHLADDPDTGAIALHLESVADGPALLASVRAAVARKPVVALVVGRHDVGDFARSHTGALATSWRVTRDLLRQAGAVVVDDVDQLATAVSVLATVRAPAAPDPGVGLVTAQAGPGLVMVDALQQADLRIPALADDTRDRLAGLLPPVTYQANPVDTGRPGPHHDAVVAAVAEDAGVDLVGVYALTEPVVDLVGSVASTVADGHPLVVGVDGPEDDVLVTRDRGAKAGVPVVVGPTALVTALTALAADARGQHAATLDLTAPPVTEAPPVALPGGPLDEAAAKDVLDALGVVTPDRRRCRTRDEAQAALVELGGPVAMKVADSDLLHKTDVGGVALDLDTDAAVDDAFARLGRLGSGEVLVERMAGPGTDLLVAARRDPVFGPVVALGVGGTAAEVYDDVAVAAYPCSGHRLEQLADRLHARSLLDGHRGSAPVDRLELARVLAALGDLLVAHPDLDEVEVNPLRATADGLVALDAVVLRTPSHRETTKEQAP